VQKFLRIIKSLGDNDNNKDPVTNYIDDKLLCAHR